MSNEKVHLNEKGFGNQLKGAASIVCGDNGEPLTLRLLVLPDGAIGGVATLLPNDQWEAGKVKSFMPKSAYYLALKRNGTLGTVNVKHYDGIIMDMEAEVAFIYDNEQIKFVSSDGMKGSDEAKELLNEKLWNPMIKALQRSYDLKSDKLYYGGIAQDATVMKMHFHKDKQNIKQ